MFFFRLVFYRRLFFCGFYVVRSFSTCICFKLFFVMFGTFFRLGLGVLAQMTFMKLDLSSLESVRAFVAEFKASKLGLDSLVLNAGVMHNVRV